MPLRSFLSLSLVAKPGLVWVSPGVVGGADPGSGRYQYPKRDFEVVFPMRSDRK
jgi:hypothetical protein